MIKDKQKSPEYNGQRVQPGGRVVLEASVHEEISANRYIRGLLVVANATGTWYSTSRDAKPPAICRSFKENWPLMKIFPLGITNSTPIEK